MTASLEDLSIRAAQGHVAEVLKQRSVLGAGTLTIPNMIQSWGRPGATPEHSYESKVLKLQRVVVKANGLHKSYFADQLQHQQKEIIAIDREAKESENIFWKQFESTSSLSVPAVLWFYQAIILPSSLLHDQGTSPPWCQS